MAPGPVDYYFLFPEEDIVGWKLERITAATACHAAITGRDVRAAFVASARVINHTLVSEDEGHVIERVVEFAAAVPGVQSGLCHPNSIDGIVSRGLRFTYAQEALAHRSVDWEPGRRRRCKVIRGLHIKCNHRAGCLPWNGSAKNPIASHGVTARPAVVHGEGRIIRVGIQPILEQHR